jgi:hypothetical protein
MLEKDDECKSKNGKQRQPNDENEQGPHCSNSGVIENSRLNDSPAAIR